ncbi:rCG26555, isoform CRA_e [Rattus norvegicus]|uniref:RCG26555, isoform CRA_e n=1 Tax=Rattus norvegicus TaxID=10116 RepID=A6HP75_RAT|nr:rCG26555, isoform CRA_e [Rattus norvegicus]
MHSLVSASMETLDTMNQVKTVPARNACHLKYSVYASMNFFWPV